MSERKAIVLVSKKKSWRNFQMAADKKVKEDLLLQMDKSHFVEDCIEL